MHGVFNAEILSSAASPLLGSPVENIPLQAEHHSGRRAKLFAFPPERCSPSDRNAVRIHNGMVFAFRPESRSPSTGFPKLVYKRGNDISCLSRQACRTS